MAAVWHAISPPVASAVHQRPGPAHPTGGHRTCAAGRSGVHLTVAAFLAAVAAWSSGCPSHHRDAALPLERSSFPAAPTFGPVRCDWSAPDVRE